MGDWGPHGRAPVGLDGGIRAGIGPDTRPNVPVGGRDVAGALAAAVTHDLVEAARPLPGVMHVDTGSDLTDPAALTAAEVSEDSGATEPKQALPEVAKAVAVVQGARWQGCRNGRCSRSPRRRHRRCSSRPCARRQHGEAPQGGG